MTAGRRWPASGRRAARAVLDVVLAVMLLGTAAVTGCGGSRDCVVGSGESRGGQVNVRAGEPRRAASAEAARRAADRAADKVERSLRQRPSAGPTILALSGGGELGAFGAGFLNGWTQKGDRPEFDVVTGVSTGSLMATFAFLGPEYDATLHRAYTTITGADVYDQRCVLSWPFSDSLATTGPLRRMIEGYVDDAVLERVARELTEKHRRLIVGAVNLDLGVFVPIDLTEIAASGDPDARRRYVDALMASAAIPVQFPPVFIDGFMFVDGGARRNVFMETLVARAAAVARDRGGATPTVYVLLNNHLQAGWECVKDNLLGVGLRSVSVLMNEALQGNVLRIYLQARRADVRFRMAWIPLGACDSERSGDGDMFDPAYMRCLYEFGVHLGQRDDAWTEDPLDAQ